MVMLKAHEGFFFTWLSVHLDHFQRWLLPDVVKCEMSP